MKMNIKNIIMFVIILVIVVALYFVFFGGKAKLAPSAAPNSSLTTSSTGAAPVNSIINQTPVTSADATKISQEFVSQLLNLQAIKLNDDILSSIAFQSLQDFTITLIQPGNEGRPNPFAPFGADGIDPNATGTPSGVIIPVTGNATTTPSGNASSTLSGGNHP